LKVGKAFKRIVALGTGATMMGATILGAMAAADLKDYPSPFVKDGKFNALMVVGDNANAADVIGSVDIATSLQYNARTKKTISTSSTGSTSVEGAVKIETSAQKLRFGNTTSFVKETITSTDWPTLLGSGSFTDNDGTTFSYTQQIGVMNSTIKYDKTSLDLDSPVLFLDWRTSPYPTYFVQIDFPTATNLSKATNKVIKLLGKEWTLAGSASEIETGTAGSEKVTLYGGGVDKTYTAGDKTTVTVGGVDIPVEVIGVNTQTTTASASIKVNGESASVTTGNTYILGGIRVYVRDIMAYTAPATSGAVRMFIGTEKTVLEHGQTVTTGSGSTDLDGVKAYFTSSGGKVSRIRIGVTPYNFGTSVKGSKKGDELVDKLFGTFKIMFTGINPELTDATKDIISLTPSSTSRLKLEFTNKNSQKYSTEIFDGNTTAPATDINYRVAGTYDFITDGGSTGRQINVDDYFMIDYGGYSHILRLTNIKNSTTSREIKVKDEAGDSNSWTITNGIATLANGDGSMVYDGKSYTFNVHFDSATATNNYVNVSSAVENARSLYTKGGAKILLPSYNGTLSGTLITNGTGNSGTEIVVVEEDSSRNYNAGTPDAHGAINMTVTFDNSRTGNRMRVSQPTYNGTKGPAYSGFVQIGNTGYDYGAITPYGTYVQYNSDTARSDAKLYYSTSETFFDVFFAPIGAVSTSTAGGAGTVTYYETTAVAVGAAVLSSEAGDVKTKNVILVGGPCANSAAATIMGSPQPCSKDFTEGKALLKLYENSGNVALLVAGYSAMDTRRASRVVADYGKYSLKGAEMEVTGTSQTEIGLITVAAPTATTNSTA